MIPDLIVGSLHRLATVADAGEVEMVGEVTSESTTGIDRVLKMRFYAQAGIEWYLLAEPDLEEYASITLRLHRLEGAPVDPRHENVVPGRLTRPTQYRGGVGNGPAYVEHAVAENGEVLKTEQPFRFEVDPARLLNLRRGSSLRSPGRRPGGR